MYKLSSVTFPKFKYLIYVTGRPQHERNSLFGDMVILEKRFGHLSLTECRHFSGIGFKLAMDSLVNGIHIPLISVSFEVSTSNITSLKSLTLKSLSFPDSIFTTVFNPNDKAIIMQFFILDILTYSK